MLSMFNMKIIMQITVTYQNNSKKTIELPEGSQELTRDVFGAEALEHVSRISIPNGILTINDHVFTGCTNLSSIDLPTSLTHLRNHAFTHCTSLSSISLPSSLTYLRSDAFTQCTSLSSISLPPSLTVTLLHNRPACSRPPV